MEATYGWYWAVDALRAAGAQVHLAHPLGSRRRVPDGSRATNKTPTILPICRERDGCRRRGSPRRPPASCGSWWASCQAGRAPPQLQSADPRGAGQEGSTRCAGSSPLWISRSTLSPGRSHSGSPWIRGIGRCTPSRGSGRSWEQSWWPRSVACIGPDHQTRFPAGPLGRDRPPAMRSKEIVTSATPSKSSWSPIRRHPQSRTPS